MMEDWDRRYPGRTESVFTAMQNILPSHLADNAQFDFRGLTLATVVEEGDIAFDPPKIPAGGGMAIDIPGE